MLWRFGNNTRTRQEVNKGHTVHSWLLRRQLANSHFLDVFSELSELGFWDSNTQVSLRPVFSWGHQDRSLGRGKPGRVQDSGHPTREAVSWGRGLAARQGSSCHRTFSLWPKEGGGGRSPNPAYLNVCFLIRVLQIFRLVFQRYHLI